MFYTRMKTCERSQRSGEELCKPSFATKGPRGGGVYLYTSCSHHSVYDEVIDNTKVTSFAAVVAFSYASILLSYARFDATGVGC